MKKYNKIIKKSLIWIFWDLLGLHAIYNLIIPPRKDNKKPPTFFLWIVGLYTALYGIAYQRYESKLNTIEVKISSIFGQLSTSQYKEAISEIPKVQNTYCPIEPEYFRIAKTIKSLVDKENRNEHINNYLKSTIISWNGRLNGTNLSKVDLSGIKTFNLDLSNCILYGANFSNSIMIKTNFKNSFLLYADFSNSDLSYSDFTHSKIGSSTIFTNTNLEYTKLDSASNYRGVELMFNKSFINFLNTLPSLIGKGEKIDDPDSLEKYKQVYEAIKKEHPYAFDRSLLFEKK